jgi:hypothetical protein
VCPFVTRQTSILCCIPCQTRSSMSAVTDEAASEMRRFNSSMSVGKGGTYTKPLMYPHKKKSQSVRSGDLGGHFIKGESACPARPIQLLDRCSFRCARTTL